MIKNHDGRLLEPSCGDGAFSRLKNNNSIFIEIDGDVVSDPDVLVMDFFDYPEEEKFATIIGNPPYVDNSLFTPKHKTDIKVQANLYLYFIEKCIHHLEADGELIFIVPRDFIKLTSAKTVNKLLYKNGTITDFYDYGDERLFDGACPNVCIFRFEKNNFTRKTRTFDGVFTFAENDGLISFVGENQNDRLGDFFEIKVGAVSGADKYFENEKGIEFVFSKTRVSGKHRKMIYQKYDKSLDEFKEKLINRGIKKFDESTWYMWGRPVDFQEGKPRLYVNCKTRVKNPFFVDSCERWDGSLLALFPKKDGIDIKEAAEKLNSIDWNSLGFMTGGRYIFAQKSLQEAPIDGTLFE